MGRWAVLAACSLLCLPTLSAQSPRKSRTPADLPAFFKAFQSYDEKEGLTRVVFKNGLTVVVEEHPNTPMIAVVSLVKIGGRHEVDSELAAEFAGEVFQENIASAGGFAQVRAGATELFFASVVPAEKILNALESHTGLFSPRAYDLETLTFLAEGIQRNRQNRVIEQPIQKTLLENYFLDSDSAPLAVPSEEKYLQFCRAHYRPGNVIVGVSGTGRNEQILSELVDLFGEQKAVKPAAGARVIPEEVGPAGKFTYHHEQGDVAKPLILLGYPVPSRGHADYPAVKLLEYVLGVGNSALLNSHHDDESLNEFLAQVSLEAGASGDWFLVCLVPEPKSIDRAEIRSLALIEALKQTDLPPLLLNRAKALMLTDYYDSLSQLDQRAYSLVFAEAAGDFLTRNRMPQILAEISSQTLKRVLTKYFSPERLTIVEFLPKAAEERTFSTEAFKEALSILVPGEVRNQISVVEVYRSDSKDPVFQAPKFEPSYSEQELKRTSILRGPEIYLKEEHSMPLVHLGFFFPGGEANEVISNAGITHLMLQAILENYIRRGGLLLTSRLEALGVQMSLVVQPDFFGVQAVVLSPQLNDGIWELIRWVRSPEIEEVDVERGRAALLRQFSLEAVDKMLESAKKQIYGDHPYGFSLDQKRNNIETLSFAAVAAWKEKYLDKLNPHIFALGDVNGTAFIKDLVSDLSDRRYRAGAAVDNDVPVPEETTSPFKVISNPEMGRAIMVCAGPKEGSEFAEMLDVGLELLGGPNGLLTKSLEKDRKLITHLRLERETGVGGGAVFIEIGASPSNLSEGVEGVRRCLNEFSDKSVPEALFLDSLVVRLSKHYYRRQVRAAFLLELMRAALAEEPVNYGERYVLNVRQLRIGEIAAALQRFLGEEQ